MITVVCSSGDTAEAEDPEAAILAGATLIRDASTTYYARPTVSFYGPDGMLVRADQTLADLSLGGNR